MRYSIWELHNNGQWYITYHQNLTLSEATSQLAVVVEGELRKTQPGRIEYEIRPHFRFEPDDGRMTKFAKEIANSEALLNMYRMEMNDDGE